MPQIVFKAVVRKRLTGIFVILLSENGFESNCPEKSSKQSLFEVSLTDNSSKAHCGTLDSYFQSNDYVSVSLNAVWSN